MGTPGPTDGRVHAYNGFYSFTRAKNLNEERAVWLVMCNYRALRVYKAADCAFEETVLHIMEMIARRPNANGTSN